MNCMICFKTSAELDQWRGVHPILKEVVKDWARIWGELTFSPVVVLTQIFRTRQQTIQIYQAAGLEPPSMSVHETRPEQWVELSGIRGVDASTRKAQGGAYGSWVQVHPELVREAVLRLNGLWQYQSSNAHQVADYHDVGGTHVHLQCRPDAETHRR